MNEIIGVIDAEIAKLQRVRAMLAGSPDAIAEVNTIAKRRGRPKGSVNKPITPVKKARGAAQKTTKKRAAKKAVAAKSQATE